MRSIMEKDHGKILTVKEAAKLRGSSPKALLCLIRKKRLRATYFNGSYKIRKKDLEECLETTEVRRDYAKKE